jgi:hypothetical protein
VWLHGPRYNAPRYKSKIRAPRPRARVADRSRAGHRSWRGAYQTVEEIGIIRTMAQGLRELVGRVMIDPDFLAELQRAPETLLAEYELSDAERATVQQALARLAKTPSSERRHEFRSSLISRVAT